MASQDTKRRYKVKKRFGLRRSLLVVMAVLLSLLSTSVPGIAENESASDMIVSFIASAGEIMVPLGTEKGEIPLPQLLEVVFSGGAAGSIPINWTDGGLYDKDNAGTYIFTADIGGYSYPGARPTAIVTVSVEGDMIPAALSDYTIDISTVSGSGTGYTFSGTVLTFNSASNGNVYTITGATASRRIVVASSSPTLILDGLEIISSAEGVPPFSLTGYASPTLELAAGSTNTLDCTFMNTGSRPEKNNAALSVPSGTTVTITGSGALNVSGGAFGAGIGGSGNSASATKDCGTVNIAGGRITAVGKAAAGIGGSGGGTGGTINITGGFVHATGGSEDGKTSSGAAGIGGGNGAVNGGTIKISGGAEVVAYAALGGAGIGGGYSSPNGSVEISGSGTKVTAMAYANGGGAGIGGGSFGLGGGGTVKITQGADVTAIGGNRGSGIGAGHATTIGGAILTMDQTVTVKAFSAPAPPNQAPVGDGAKPAIHTSSNAGTGYYINAVLNADESSATKLEIKNSNGITIGTIIRPDPTMIGYHYRGFAFTCPSLVVGDYSIYAYNTAGELLGQIHTVAGTAPESAKIAAVNAGASSLGGATQVYLGEVVAPPANPSAGVLTVSDITSTQAKFTNIDHDLDGTAYSAGYFRYSQSLDAQGSPSGGMQLAWQATFPGTPYSLMATGLTPDTQYYGQTSLQTSAGTVTGNVVQFTTPPSGVTYFTVRFNSQGGSAVSDITAAAGSTIAIPAPPTKSGSIFSGWYKEATLTTPWVFDSDKVTGDVTLYAKWAAGATMYTVSFNSLGGSTVADIQVVAGNMIAKPANPTKSGYMFGGWYKEPTLKNEWFFTVETVTRDMTLYAKWSAYNASIVSFNPMGGSAVPSVAVMPNDLVPKPSPNPTKSGYTFEGWYWEEVCINVFRFETQKCPGGNFTLYAKWSVGGSYMVTFNTRGGGTIDPIMVKAGMTFSKPHPDPTQSQNLFLAWFTELECINVWNFPTDVVTRDMTLYAGWLYGNTVRFDSQGGSAVPSVTVMYGSSISAPSPAPTKAGFDMSGWYKEPACINAWDFSSESVCGDVTLYAKWVEAAPQVLELTLTNTTVGSYANLTQKFFYSIYVYDASGNPSPDGTQVPVGAILEGNNHGLHIYTVKNGMVGNAAFGMLDGDQLVCYLPNISGGSQVGSVRIVRETVPANGDSNYIASYVDSTTSLSVVGENTGVLLLSGANRAIDFTNTRYVVPTGVSSSDTQPSITFTISTLLLVAGFSFAVLYRLHSRRRKG